MKNIITLTRWLLGRLFLLKRVKYILIDFFLYSKTSKTFYKSIPQVSNEIEHTRYYNAFGRILFASKEIIALISNEKIFKKSITLESYESLDFKELYKEGSHPILWPKSPFVELEKTDVSDDFIKKISSSYDLSYQNDPLNIDKEYIWEKHVEEFKSTYFTDNGKLEKERLINFRKEKNSTAHILTDHFNVINNEFGYFKSYLKSIELILEYHRLSNFVNHSILGSISESFCGEISTPIYRGQRLSDRILFLSTVMSEIQKHIEFNDNDRKVIVDIGGGFGHIGRFTHNYIPNSCYILVELNEMACFGSYFLKYTFPDKKVATYIDIVDRLDNFQELIEEYDFIIIPTWLIKAIPNEFVDLYIATGSIAEMPKEYAQMYLDEVDRTLKYNGYFYTNSRVKVEEAKPYLYILYKWKLKSKFLTLSYQYHPVNLILETSPQWIGKKIK